MTFHPIPSTAQVDMVYDQAGQPCENRYFVHSSTAWDLAALAALEGVFVGWEVATAKLLRNTDTTLIKFFARDMSASDGAEVEFSEAVIGTLTGTPLPQNCTISLKAQTGAAGRDRRGRTYWIGMSAAMESANPGEVQGSYVTSLVSAMNALVGAVVEAGKTLVVAHRKVGSAYIDPAVTHTIISYTAADHFFDSQRRRLPGHNRHR